eukprot:2457292-Prymnesium_polylepis.1
MQTRPVAKTTELGGVAPGSMKANEHETAVGSMSASGWVSVSNATADIMSIMMFAVAVSDVIVVTRLMTSTIRKLRPTGPMCGTALPR